MPKTSRRDAKGVWRGEGVCPRPGKFWNFLPGNSTKCILLVSSVTMICGHWSIWGHASTSSLNTPLGGGIKQKFCEAQLDNQNLSCSLFSSWLNSTVLFYAVLSPAFSYPSPPFFSLSLFFFLPFFLTQLGFNVKR